MLRLLTVDDLQLAGCTRWRSPDGVVYLELPHVISLYQALTANQPILPDVQLGTPPEFDFVVKVVSYTGLTPGTLIQIQWPDGRYLSNPGVDAFSFIGTGKRGRLVSHFKTCPASSKIRVTFDNSAVSAASNTELHFEGVLRIPLVPRSNGGAGAGHAPGGIYLP